MSIFSRDTAAWAAQFVSQFQTIDSVVPFVFFDPNAAIAASGVVDVTFPAPANAFFICDAYIGLRNNIQLAIELEGLITPGPRMAYSPVGPGFLHLESIFFRKFILNEIAGVAGNYDLSIVGSRVNYS